MIETAAAPEVEFRCLRTVPQCCGGHTARGLAVETEVLYDVFNVFKCRACHEDVL